MRKISFVLLLALVFVLAACGGKEAAAPAETSEEVVSAATAVPEPTATSQPTATPEPTNTPEPTAAPSPVVELAEAIRSEEGGYAFSPPAGWEVESRFDTSFLTMAPGADEDLGPLIMLFSETQDQPLTLDEATAFYVAEISEENEVTLSEPIDLTIGGLAARQVDATLLEGENNTQITVRFTVAVPRDGHSFLIVGSAPVDQWEEIAPVYEAALNSVSFFEPATADSFETPEGFLWRAGGESGISEGQFAALGGVAVDENNVVYVTDNINGVLVFDAAGNMLASYDIDEFTSPSDVAVDGSGNIIVADWASRAIYVLDAGGNLTTQFGSEGTGPGQFAEFGLEAVTVDANGNIYALDNNETEAGDKFTRVEVFDGSGSFLYEFPVEMDFFSGQDIAYWPGEDTLYVISFINDNILEYDLQGNLLRQIPAFDFSGAQAIDLDAAGNIYAAVWTPPGVMKFDHDGNLLDSWGVEVEDGGSAWPEGGLYQPAGVGVSRDGDLTAVSDWSGKFSFLTAFMFP